MYYTELLINENAYTGSFLRTAFLYATYRNKGDISFDLTVIKIINSLILYPQCI